MMADRPPASSTWLATLHPAYFAMVMATGIVSIASFLTGLETVAVALFACNVAFYPALWTLTLFRLWWYPDRVRADVMDHGRSVGFFTTIAATCVLGSQCLVIAGWRSIAEALWVFGIGLWAVLVYGIFTILTVKKEKPALPDGLNGGWLVSVVATQSVSVLGTQLASGFGTYENAVLFFSLVMWLGGGMFLSGFVPLNTSLRLRSTFSARRP